MNRKRIGGLILLIVIVGIAGVFYLINRDTHPESDVVFEPPSDEVIGQIQTDIAERNAQDADKTPSPGEKEETGHRHADGTWHEGAHDTTSETPSTVSEKVPGKLTYHKELLEKHPVEALRQQTIERGHWSAKWIPPFPPDDQEAATYARIRYLLIYYDSIGDTENPEYKAARRRFLPTHRAIRAYPHGARRSDLMKLTWPNLDEQPYPMYDARGSRRPPSDFFPQWRSEAEKRKAYGDFYEVFEALSELEKKGLLPK